MGQVQPFPHPECARNPLEQRETVLEPGGAERLGEIGSDRISPGHHQHRQPESLGQVRHVHNREPRDRDAAQDHSLEPGAGAEPADPAATTLTIP